VFRFTKQNIFLPRDRRFLPPIVWPYQCRALRGLALTPDEFQSLSVADFGAPQKQTEWYLLDPAKMGPATTVARPVAFLVSTNPAPRELLPPPHFPSNSFVG